MSPDVRGGGPFFLKLAAGLRRWQFLSFPGKCWPKPLFLSPRILLLNQPASRYEQVCERCFFTGKISVGFFFFPLLSAIHAPPEMG